MIKAIIFDCFGVLTADSWREYCNSLPPSIDVEAARRLNLQMDAGLITKEEFLGQASKITKDTPQEMSKHVANETSKNGQLLGYIKQLKLKYKIGLISNIASDWICGTFLSKEEQLLFDDMVLSYKVGMTKPDPRIYLLACQRLSVEPEEVIYVDDIEQYSQAAKAVGIKAIVYVDFDQLVVELEDILQNC